MRNNPAIKTAYIRIDSKNLFDSDQKFHSLSTSQFR
jgi:hypothetical protein